MAVTPVNPPSQSQVRRVPCCACSVGGSPMVSDAGRVWVGNVQFFGALAVGALILVCTAVVMTERPVWMVGEEPPLGMLRPFSEPAPPQPVYSQAQLKKMATMGE